MRRWKTAFPDAAPNHLIYHIFHPAGLTSGGDNHRAQTRTCLFQIIVDNDVIIFGRTVIMTRNATEFVSPMTFETLVNNRVAVDTFDRGFAGSTTATPNARRVCRLRWVTGLSYIPVFIAGATIFGHRAANTVVHGGKAGEEVCGGFFRWKVPYGRGPSGDRPISRRPCKITGPVFSDRGNLFCSTEKPSCWGCPGGSRRIKRRSLRAIFAITFAVAGAIRNTSAFFASATCSTLYSKPLSKEKPVKKSVEDFSAGKFRMGEVHQEIDQ